MKETALRLHLRNDLAELARAAAVVERFAAERALPEVGHVEDQPGPGRGAHQRDLVRV